MTIEHDNSGRPVRAIFTVQEIEDGLRRDIAENPLLWRWHRSATETKVPWWKRLFTPRPR